MEEHNDMLEATGWQDSRGARDKTRKSRANERLEKSRHGKAIEHRQSQEMSESETQDIWKGAWGMPRLSEAKKDVTSCEKPRRGANTLRPADIRMGQPGGSDPAITQ